MNLKAPFHDPKNPAVAPTTGALTCALHEYNRCVVDYSTNLCRGDVIGSPNDKHEDNNDGDLPFLDISRELKYRHYTEVRGRRSTTLLTYSTTCLQSCQHREGSGGKAWLWLAAELMGYAESWQSLCPCDRGGCLFVCCSSVCRSTSGILEF